MFLNQARSVQHGSVTTYLLSGIHCTLFMSLKIIMVFLYKFFFFLHLLPSVESSHVSILRSYFAPSSAFSGDVSIIAICFHSGWIFTSVLGTEQ